MKDEDRALLPPEGGEGEPPEEERRYARSEEQLLGDGQLGAQNLERGPERQNPEGTSHLPNPAPEER